MNKEKNKIFSPKHYFVMSLILLIYNVAFSQNKTSYGLGIKFAPSIVFYDNKTSDYIKNQCLMGADAFIFYNHFTLSFRQNSSFTFSNCITKDIEYQDKVLLNTQKIRLELNCIELSYRINLKNKFTIDPYIGRLYYWIIDKEKDKGLIRVRGYIVAIELNKYFFKDNSGCVYFRDQVNITNLSKVNSNLGNFANIIEIGIGGRFGKLNKGVN
jgi:hypothetical protein